MATQLDAEKTRIQLNIELFVKRFNQTHLMCVFYCPPKADKSSGAGGEGGANLEKIIW
jgi:hypothetical protein